MVGLFGSRSRFPVSQHQVRKRRVVLNILGDLRPGPKSLERLVPSFSTLHQRSLRRCIGAAYGPLFTKKHMHIDTSVSENVPMSPTESVSTTGIFKVHPPAGTSCSSLRLSSRSVLCRRWNWTLITIPSYRVAQKCLNHSLSGFQLLLSVQRPMQAPHHIAYVHVSLLQWTLGKSWWRNVDGTNPLCLTVIGVEWNSAARNK
jgi:hypothetical protein